MSRWENKAWRGIRLAKTDGDTYTEIGSHTGNGSLFIEAESLRQGKRLYNNYTTAKSLMEQYPDLKPFENLLYTCEKLAKVEKNNIELNNQIRQIELAKMRGRE